MPTIPGKMNTHNRMKGNRSSAGETLPGIPFDWAPPRVSAAPMHNAPAMAATTGPHSRWRLRRAIMLPSVALIGVAGLVVAVIVALGSGGDSTAAADSPAEPEMSLALALPGTPTPTPTSEPVATIAPTEPATVATTDAGATGETATATLPATAEPTIAVPVRVRYEVLPGDSCDLLRQKFGFPATALDDFATALARVSGRPPASGCNFRQADVVCIPTPADLLQLDALTRDTGCLLNGAAADS